MRFGFRDNTLGLGGTRGSEIKLPIYKEVNSEIHKINMEVVKLNGKKKCGKMEEGARNQRFSFCFLRILNLIRPDFDFFCRHI
jgi:hypothetical protein